MKLILVFVLFLYKSFIRFLEYRFGTAVLKEAMLNLERLLT